MDSGCLPMMPNATYTPIMKKWPCAMLRIFRMPKIQVSPAATRKIAIPVAIPL